MFSKEWYKTHDHPRGMLGKKHSRLTIVRISNELVGRKRSKKTKLKLSKSKLGENNPMWVGDKVGYISLHIWVKTRLKEPRNCPECGKHKKMDLCNKSGKYLRELTDWKYLCRKCHMESDNRINSRDLSGRFRSGGQN